MFLKILKILLVAVFAVMVSGCVVGLPVLFVTAHDAGAVDEKLPFVEIQDIKIGKGVDISVVKSARMTSHILKKDMATLNESPRSSDKEVNVAVTEEVRRSLATGISSSPVVARVDTFYYDGGYPWGYYYYSGTSKKSISYWQQSDVGKAVNFRLTLQQGDTILLEAHGLWWGNDEDHIAGARKLAREMVSEVLKKLGSPTSRPPVAEAKKE